MTEKFIKYKKNEFEEVAVLSDDYIQEKNEKLYQKRLELSGIPEKYWDLHWGLFYGDKTKEEFWKIEKYMNNIHDDKFKHLNLYLTGEQSTQKTFSACNIGKAFINEGMRVKFIYAGELIDKLMKTQGFSYIKEIEDFLDSLYLNDLIIIDDFGDKLKSVYWSKSDSLNLIISAWDKFLRRVISENIRLVMTSNFSFASIKDSFGISLYELLYRNFEEIIFYEYIGNHVRNLKFENIWD